MYWITEAGESTLIFLTNILATPLYFFFEFSFISGEIFLKVLRIVATILYYFHAVGFSNILLTVPLFRPFRISAESDFWRRHVCLIESHSLRTVQLDSHCENFH